MSYSGGSVGVKKTRANKAYNWELAELILGMRTHTKGSNLTVAQIATSNI